MTLLNKTQASLTGGISQQPSSMRLSSQCTEQINLRCSLVNGLQSRQPLKFINSAFSTEGKFAFFNIDRDETYKYNLAIANGSNIYIYDTSGTVQTVTVTSAAQQYLNTNLLNTDTYKQYKLLTLADQTFILNTQRTTALTSNTYTAWQNKALVFIKSVEYTTTWTLTIKVPQGGGAYTTYTHSVGIGGSTTDGTNPKAYIDGVEQTDRAELSTSWVASTLKGLFDSDFSIQQSGAVLCIARGNGEEFEIGLSDSRGDSVSSLVTNTVQDFDKLPTVAPDGFIVKVLGEQATDADDYYVEFIANSSSSFTKGVWKECACPGIRYEIDANTMPVKLVHTSGTSWTVDVADWEDRIVGDDDSNPVPEFIGKKLNNIFLFQGRLCVLAEDLICMSRANEYTNFWVESATTLSDSDPINLSASIQRYTELVDFAVLDDDLILFSTEHQYRLSTGDILSPKTASIRPISSYVYERHTGIITTGSKLFFGNKSGNWFNINEYAVSALTGQKEAISLTGHVPNLMRITNSSNVLQALKICGTDNAKVLCVFNTDQRESAALRSNTLYVYQYYISGAQKLQSAWSKYTFTGMSIRGAFFRENILWLLLLKNGVNFIATMDFSEKVNTSTPETALDLITQLTVTGTNQITLPNYLSASTAIEFVGYRTGTTELTKCEVSSRSGTTVTLEGSWSTVYVGEKFSRYYEFSTVYPTTKKADGSEIAVTSGRWQLQKLSLNCGATGPFTVTVKLDYDSSFSGYKYEFTGKILGTQNISIGELTYEDPVFTLPLRGRNTDLRVIIESDSWIPQALKSAEWQGLYITKVRQV